jgi:hypothetical protein
VRYFQGITGLTVGGTGNGWELAWDLNGKFQQYQLYPSASGANWTWPGGYRAGNVPFVHSAASGLPAAGDVISLADSGVPPGSSGVEGAGHTGVVTQVSVDGSGNGNIYFAQQNWDSGSQGSWPAQGDISVSSWAMSDWHYNEFNWVELAGGGPPTPPLVVVSQRTFSSVTLTWTEPAAGVATSYEILRNGDEIGATTSLSFTDSAVGDGSRSYQVVAVNGSQLAASTAVATDATSSFGLRADVAGNHKDDLVYVYPGGDGGGTNDIVTFLSKGNGTYTEVDQQIRAGDFRLGSWFVGDVTGDGKADLVYEFPGGDGGSSNDLVTFVSKGNGTYSEVDQQLRAGDFVLGIWM